MTGGHLTAIPGLPSDMAAEQVLLGQMMLNREAIDDTLELVKPHDHFRPAHQIIHETILDLYSGGAPTDAVSVGGELVRTGQIGLVGGAPYLHTCISVVPSTGNAPYYARIVRERAVLRRLVEVGTKIADSGSREHPAPLELVDQAEAAVFGIREDATDTDLTPVGDLARDSLDGMERIAKAGGLTGVPTGFSDLDDLTNGLHPKQLIVVAARPALGKSTLALDIARHAAIRHGDGVAIFSLEMSREEIMWRMWSAEARVPLQAIRSGQMSTDDWQRVGGHIGDVAGAPLYVDDSPDISIASIRAKSRRLAHRLFMQNGHRVDGKGQLRLIIVDYLQLMSTPGNRKESRQQEVSDMSRSLKLLAKELAVPVIAVAQLNRGPEQRTDKKPMLSDLRESGAIEQDSDVVILLHREDAYERESPRAGEADLIVAKHRNGPCATVTVAFQGHYSRFVDMAPVYADVPPENAWTPSGALAR